MSLARRRTRKVGKKPADVAEQTKRDILKAGLQCFAAAGYNSTSLREIAREANISHGLLRHHFGTKDDLWKACVVFVTEQVAKSQSLLLDQVTPENALESFVAIVRVFIESSAKYPTLWRMLAFEALKDSDRLDHVLQIVWPTHAKIAPLFKTVQQQGHLSNFTNESFFLFVISLGALPFALAPFSNRLCATDILSKEQREKHANLVIDTLFGQSAEKSTRNALSSKKQPL